MDRYTEIRLTLNDIDLHWSVLNPYVSLYVICIYQSLVINYYFSYLISIHFQIIIISLSFISIYHNQIKLDNNIFLFIINSTYYIFSFSWSPVFHHHWCSYITYMYSQKFNWDTKRYFKFIIGVMFLHLSNHDLWHIDIYQKILKLD